MIYLDNSATTKPYKEVLETYTTVSSEFFANPSSLHKLGGRSENLLNKAREQAAELLQVKPKEIIFTSGGTEGNNLAIKGTALYYRNRGRHIITTDVEHASAYESFQQLEELGFDVTYLKTNQYGCITVSELENALREDTILVSLLHVNNELGSIQPLEEISEVLRKRTKVKFHVDHVQGLGKVPINFLQLGIDLCTMSGHKIHGPKGTGILFIKEGLGISPLLSGGGQEFNRRSGTENLPGVVAMVKALRMTLEKSNVGIAHMKKLQHILSEGLSRHDSIIIHTPQEKAAPHILNFSILNIKPEVMIHALEEKDIYISTKSACSSKQSETSRVLLASGIKENVAKYALRISLSYLNTEEEIQQFLDIFNNQLSALKQVMG